MINIGVSVRRLAIALAVLSACSVPPVDFTGTDDAGTPDTPPDTPDVVELVVSTNAITVGEAATATFTVALSASPPGSVLVSVDSADANRVGVAPTSIQFDSTNWDQARTITLSGQEDADTENEAVDVTVSSSVGTEVIAVTVADNDSLGIVVAPTGDLEVSEGGSATLAVRLSAQPSGTVSVTVASSDTAAAGVSPTTLTFGTSTWDIDQNVVVTGEHDADVTDDAATVTLSATGLTSATVDVTVIDDDLLGIQPSTTNLGTLAEGGTTTFTVRLTQQPTSNVSVAVSSSDTTILTVSPTPLTFTSTTWNTPQTVTVNLPEDVDTADETATISLVATGLTTRSVSATIDDNDTQVIVAAPDPVPVDEGGTRALNVRLQYQPSADITLTVTSLNTGVATVSTGTLTFTPANYDTNQMVTVSAPEDADAAAGMTTIRLQSLPDALSRDVSVAVTDNDQLLIDTSVTAVTVGEAGTATFGVRLTAMPGASVTVSVSSGDPTVATVSPAMLTFTTANYGTYQMVTVSGVGDVDLTDEMLTLTLTAAGLPAKTVDATVTDDDMQAVVLSLSTISVNEGGTGTVGVSLAYMPAASVTVTLGSMDATAATVSPTTLTFTPAGYATPQNVTITGVGDADAVDDMTTITASAPGAASDTVMVTVQDDDALGIETSHTTVSVPEAGTATFTVRLTAQPAATTTVMVMSEDVTAVTATPTMLTFTTANYATPQTVTLTGVDDVDAINDSVDVSLSATGLTERTVTVTVVDDDTQEILLTTTTLSVGEAGSNTFGVRLATMPTSNVIVTVASTNTNKATASPSSLTFTSANYATNQMVTVSGVADLDLVNDLLDINLTSPGISAAVDVTVTDDDMQVVETSATGVVNLTEGGAGASIGFRLRYIPSASTTVTLDLGPGLSASSTTMTFTAANYNMFQNRTITAVEDADAADVTTSLSADAPGATSATVDFFIDDNDVLGIDVSPLSVGVTEGSTAQLGVRLTAQPAGDTTVTVASNDPTVATVTAGASLVFTTANWSTFQNATVSGVQDVDVQTEGTNLTVASTGLASRNVGVTVTDDDVITIVTSVSSLNVNEGGTASFGARLSHQPASPITVSVTSTDTAVMSISAGSTLVFDASNYATNQTVTVSGVQDADFLDESAGVTLVASGIAPRSVSATVLDDDLVLTDVGTQMGPAAGGTDVTATGGGFTGVSNVSMNGNAVASLQVGSGSDMSFRTPARSTGAPNWSDVRVVKGGNTVSIPRAFYYGTWIEANAGLNGGTATALAAPAGTSLVYAAVGTTFYRSTDGGTTYTQGGNGLPQAGLNSMVVSPADTNRLYLAAGVGLYTSSDGGTNWTRIGTFDQVSCVGIHPQMASHLFMCSAGSLYRSTDSGANWTVVLAGIPTFGNDTLTWTTSGNGAWLNTRSTVYRSIDGGATWTAANGNLPPSVSIEAVAAHPTLPSTAWLGAYPSFYKTTDGGATWVATDVSNLYPSAFAVNPTQPSIVYATTTNGVYKTTNGGTSWSPSSVGLPPRAFIFRDIVLRGSSNTVYTASQDWSIHRSVDAAATWTRADSGIQESSISHIAPHPVTAGTAYVTHSGGLARTTNHGASWMDLTSGLPPSAYGFGPIQFMPGTPSTMYLGVQNGGVYKSTDGGTVWTATSRSNGNPDAMVVDPANPDHLYVTFANQGVMRSTNGGQSFELMSTSGLPGDLNLRAMMLANGTLLVSELGGGVFRYDVTAWVPASSGLPPTTAIQHLWTDPSGAFYASTFQDTYRSTNGGQSWSLYMSGIQYIFWDPTRAQTAYLFRTNQGIERTVSAFDSIVPFSGGLPTGTFFARTAIDPSGGTIYFGAGSGGLFRVFE